MSGKGWWNSAISGLESRLDTILAEDAQGNKIHPGSATSSKQDAPEKAASDKKLAVVEPGGLSRLQR
jgi:hypothetical protein